MTGVPEPAQAPLVWIAGTSWDGVAGTDRRLVEAVSQYRQILWVDPPVAASPAQIFDAARRTLTGAGNVAATEWVTGSVLRLRVLAPPGVTRPGIRSITAVCLNRAVISALTSVGWLPEAVVLAFPQARFPARVPGRRIFYVTDDWLAGSGLMGLSRRAMKRAMAFNVGRSHVVAAVSHSLVEHLQTMLPSRQSHQPVGTPEFVVLPNGCPQPAVGDPPVRDNVAGLVGQLNERLDLDVLEAVVAAGVQVRVIGPRTDRDPGFGRRLDALLEMDSVEWQGPLDPKEIPGQLATLGAGLTPYTDSTFNRASFPLKTLEYLAAGLGVVATDSPAVRWLRTRHVTVGRSPQDFAQAVVEVLRNRTDGAGELDRRAFAANHTWDSRAREFLWLATPSRATSQADA
jgi:teichuronic acid biosynthesis glycosyltransferase TuaH